MAVPRGHGVYARGLPLDLLARFGFAAVEVTRAGSAERARALKSRGVQVWAFTGPAGWRPGRWQATLEELARWASEVGAAGLIADVEDGWGGGRPSNAREQLAAIAKALPVGSGVTSYPMLPDFDALERPWLWGSPQIYAKGRGAAAVRQFWVAWHRVWGSQRLVPSLSLWNSGVETRSEGPYVEYLRSVPSSRAYIGWPTNSPPEWRTRAFLDRRVSWWAQLPSLAEPFLTAGLALLAVGAALALWWAL